MTRTVVCSECNRTINWIDSHGLNADYYCRLCWHAVLHLDSRFGKGLTGHKNVSECTECGCVLKGKRKHCDSCERLVKIRDTPAYGEGYRNGYKRRLGRAAGVHYQQKGRTMSFGYILAIIFALAFYAGFTDRED